MKRQPLILAGLMIIMILFGNPGNAKTITVPIWKDGEGRVRVNITLENAETYAFIIDTGMWKTNITPKLVQALALKESKSASEGSGSNSGYVVEKTYQSLNVVIGGKVDFLIKTPEVLDLKFPGAPVFGILGSEFLQQYTVGFDMKAGEMILSDTGAEGMFSGSKFVKLSMYSPFANLWMTDEMQVGDVSVKAFLDTGAVESMVNTKLLETLPPEAVDLSNSKKGEVMGGSVKKTESFTAVFQETTAGARTWEDKTYVVSSGVFAQLRMNKKPAMLVGTDLMLSGRLIMDYLKGFVYFEVVE